MSLCQSFPIPGPLFAGMNLHTIRANPGQTHRGICLLLDSSCQDIRSLHVSKQNLDLPLGQGAWDVAAVEAFP